MSELAFDSQGQAIDLPDEATAWQVRRAASRGQPGLVYTADGLPLFLPVTAGIDDLHSAVGTSGLYALYAVDDQRRRIAGLPTAYVMLQPSPTRGDARLHELAAHAPLDELAALARTSQALAKQILAHVPLLLDTAQALLRIAGDADDAITAIRDLIK